MNKSLFSVIVVGSVIAAIVCGVATGEVAHSWVWGYLGLNVVWGEVGLAFAMLVTFPVLRRWDLVLSFMLGGWFFIALFGALPAVGYRDIQLYRDGVHVVAAADLGHLPAGKPVVARFSGVWRNDLAVRGTYRGSGGTDSARRHCLVEERHFCRTPVVAADWKPGDPVLALSSRCPPNKLPEPRTLTVTLFPPSHDDLGVFDFEQHDQVARTVFDGQCAFAPEIGHADLSSAPFHFDDHRGFLIVVHHHEPNPIGMFVFESLFALGALGYVLRWDYRHARIKRRSELAAA